MILTTTESINGKTYEIVDLCFGTSVLTTSALSDFTQGLKSIFGGELKKYTNLIDGARIGATDRMIEEAKKLNCDAIVGIRCSTSQVLEGASEITIYGTGVRFVE